jgi:hypothetical protein
LLDTNMPSIFSYFMVTNIGFSTTLKATTIKEIDRSMMFLD